MKRRVVHYQEKDFDIVDYQIYFRSDCQVGFRGPRVPDHLGRPYGVTLGSAAVFGRFVHQPFAQQLTLAGFPTVNLGLSGARPQAFEMVATLPSLLGRAQFTILELMSARGYKVEFFTPRWPHANMGAYHAPGEEADPKALADTPQVFVDEAWNRALKAYPREHIEAALAETRARYVEGMKRLIDHVEGELILLWLSQRPQAITPSHESTATLSGGFPHFVDGSVVDELMAHARARCRTPPRLVEVVSREGLPALLASRFDGTPRSAVSPGPNGMYNTYYPSQEMHDEAALKLLAALRASAAG